jgi:hypothetical protein
MCYSSFSIIYCPRLMDWSEDALGMLATLRDGRNVFGALHEEGAKEEGQERRELLQAPKTPLTFMTLKQVPRHAP